MLKYQTHSSLLGESMFSQSMSVRWRIAFAGLFLLLPFSVAWEFAKSFGVQALLVTVGIAIVITAMQMAPWDIARVLDRRRVERNMVSDVEKYLADQSS